MKSNLQPFLNRLTDRSRLSATERTALLQLQADVLEVEARRDFVRLDQTVDQVSVVVQGVVARFGQTADGERQITALYIAGDAPDLHSVVVPSDTVPLQALSNATILRVAHDELRTVAARYPAVAEALWRHSSVDAAITAKWVLNMGRRDAKTRISHLLCEMAVRYGATAGDGAITFSFPLTQAQLGDATGLTSVHVNRTLKTLAEEDILILAKREARIPDWGRLVKRGEFDATYLQAGFQPRERLRIAD